MNDHSSAWIWNGKEYTPALGVPVSDRGFRYGMSIFESIAVRSGEVEFLDEHLERIRVACEQCEWPVDFRALRLAGEFLGGIPSPSFARIYVTAGDGGVSDPVHEPRIYIFSEARVVRLPKAYRAIVYPTPIVPLMGGLKTGNYWANLTALNWAKSDGFDEALIFNQDGELVSSCQANVFAVLDGALVTPHLSTGARNGVVRDWVIQHYPPGKVIQRVLRWSDLDKVSECFLTNSWMGVIPVESLDTRPLNTALSEALRANFFSEVMAEFSAEEMLP
jgi:branched-subunit amino acid aminotransferase/4-amino-4-deoxychorismate lyase